MKTNWNLSEKLLVTSIIDQVLDSLSYEEDIDAYASSESLLICLSPEDVHDLKKLLGHK